MPRKTNNKRPLSNIETDPYKDCFGLVYVRVSSKKQETEGHGRDSQDERCKQDLASVGVPFEFTFPDTYTGGGDFMNRPAMREMLAYIDANPHKKFVVVFDDLKRFARDTAFHLKLRMEFKARDVKLRCLNYNFDDNSPEGMFVETVLAAGNELERHQNKRQVVQKMKARLDSGYSAFARRRGYDMVKDSVHGKISVPNKQGLEVLAPALEAFASGKLLRQIDVAKYLVERKFWTSRPPEKYLTQVKAILSDPFYAGYIEHLPWGVERRLGRHTGLISAKTFEIIQAKLERTKVQRSRPRLDISPDFPLRGLINCVCGVQMTAANTKARNKKLHPYYWCRNKNCEFYAKSIKKAELEKEFVAIIKKGGLKAGVAKVMEAVFDQVWKQEISAVAKQESFYIQEIRALEEKLKGLTELAYRAKTEPRRAVYEDQIDSVAEELQSLRGQIGSTSDLEVPYRTALSKVTRLIRSPYSVWKDMPVREQHELFFFIFDTKLTYSKKDGYRTAEMPTAARLFEDFAAADSNEVDRTGFEPATLSLQMRCSTN